MSIFLIRDTLLNNKTMEIVDVLSEMFTTTTTNPDVVEDSACAAKNIGNIRRFRIVLSCHYFLCFSFPFLLFPFFIFMSFLFFFVSV